MDRSHAVSYLPYLGRTSLHNLSFERSVVTNPLEENFHAHIALAREVLEDYDKRKHHADWHGQFRNTMWFEALPTMLENLVEAFLDYRHMDMCIATYPKYLKVSAALEVVCSIIIFSGHRDYRCNKEEDIEKLRFPLSKSSRLIVSRVAIGEKGSAMTVITRNP